MVELAVKGFGIPSEWKDFHERHQLFFERLPDLKSALEAAFIRELAPSCVADTVVFYLGRFMRRGLLENNLALQQWLRLRCDALAPWNV
jgi:hypothetical protein